MGKTKRLVAREYLRVSRDQSRRGKSPAEQHAENETSVAEQGWTLHPGEPYTDTDRSASRYARKGREQFDLLIRDVESGDFGADILVLWELSRGSRKVSEWSSMLETLADADVKVWCTSSERLYDPREDSDLDDLFQAAVDSQRESTKTSKRIRRNVKASARDGLPHGKRLYGYDRVYDEKTRELLRVEINKEEAAVVRRAGREVLAGKTFYEIAAGLNEDKVPPRRPAFKEHRKELGWTPVAIRQMLSMESYGGQRIHRSKAQGIDAVYDAKWDALFEPEEWAALQAELEKRRTVDARGQKVRPREANWTNRHLLAGLVFCGECGATMRVGKQNSGRRKPMLDADGNQVIEIYRGEERKRWEPGQTYSTYVCAGVPGKTGFHVAVKQSLLDAYVEKHVLDMLGSPTFLAELGKGQTNEAVEAERTALIEEIRADEEYLEAVREQAARDRRADLLFEQEKIVRPRIQAAQRRIHALVKTDPFVAELAKVDVAGAWQEMTLAEKRRVIKALVRPVINPLAEEKRGQRGLDESRISWG